MQFCNLSAVFQVSYISLASVIERERLPWQLIPVLTRSGADKTQ